MTVWVVQFWSLQFAVKRRRWVTFWQAIAWAFDLYFDSLEVEVW